MLAHDGADGFGRRRVLPETEGMEQLVEDERTRCDRSATITGVDPSRPVDAQIRHLGTEPLEEATGLDRRRVFDLGGDNVVRTASSGEEGTFDREVVGLAATAREDDFVGRTAEECRDLASRGLQH